MVAAKHFSSRSAFLQATDRLSYEGKSVHNIFNTLGKTKIIENKPDERPHKNQKEHCTRKQWNFQES